MSDLIIGTSYYGVRAVDYVRKDMQELKKAGFTHVLHTYSEDDMIFYRETMKEIVQASHEEGLKVLLGPWALGNAFGGEAFSRFLLYNREDWQITSDGKYYPIACLNSPSFKKLIIQWIDYASETGADSVFWDEPHWFIPFMFLDVTPGVWGCRCLKCQALYKDEYGEEMPLELTDNVKEFKNKHLSELIFSIADYAKSKNLQNILCLLPIMETKEEMNHWEYMISHPSIDVLSTDPYWEIGPEGLDSHYGMEVEDFVGFFAKQINDVCTKYNKTGQIWIQNFALKGDLSKVEIAVKAAHQQGIRNIFAWSYKATKYMSLNRCKDYNTAWQNFLKSINDIL